MTSYSASPSARPRGRGVLTTIAILSVILLGATGVLARLGQDRDHGMTTQGASSGPSPRVVATSADYQFVGIVDGEVLSVYLDRFADNMPVTSASIDISIADVTSAAKLQANGTYEVTSKLLRTPGEHAVVISIAEGTASDLLVGTLTIPKPRTTPAGEHTLWSHFALRPTQAAGVGGGGILLAMGLAGLLLSPLRRTAIAASAVGAGLLLVSTAFAHEGRDHGIDSAVANGNAPHRLSDGSIFLPKPTQRLLEVRTRIMQLETASRATRFHGRIVANPNKSGVVQSTIQGRFTPPPGGVPALGTHVSAGDLMGKIAPSFVSKEASDMLQTLADLDQQITLVRSKLARNEELLRTSVVSKVTVDELRIQLEGLLKRRSDLVESRVQPEELRAPVDGVITSVRVVSGQVVSQSDQLFQIVDPSSFFVEALMFDHVETDQVTSASASLASGRSFKLRFLGRSRSLQQQYSVLKFEVMDPTDELNLGTPVIVTSATGGPVTGLRVPRAAVAQAPNGQMVVFVHKEAEIFEPRAVRYESFDANTVLLTAGVAEGDKVVVQNASLVNQVR